MRIVVTGAAGFIGSHLSELLLASDHDVVGVDCFTDYYPRRFKQQNLATARSHRNFAFHDVDLRVSPLHDILEGADAVVHAAAMPGLPRSWVDFPGYVGCNIHATQRVLEASRDVGVNRFLYISTSSVYGTNAVGDEHLPTSPVSPYGVTKLAAEHLAEAYHETFGLPVTILRYFSVYGPRQRPDMAYHLFIESMLEGRPITIHGDGKQSRSSTYVSDCVRGTMQALLAAPDGEIYNIGGGEVISVNETIEVIADALDVRPHIVHSTARAGDQRHTAADTRAAAAAFGYRPEVKPLDGLLRQVAWHRDRAAGGVIDLRKYVPAPAKDGHDRVVSLENFSGHGADPVRRTFRRPVA